MVFRHIGDTTLVENKELYSSTTIQLFGGERLWARAVVACLQIVDRLSPLAYIMSTRGGGGAKV